MKNLISISILILAMIAISCNNGQQAKIQYKKHMSHNKAYEVEVPAYFTQIKSGDYLMAFSNEKDYTTLLIDVFKEGENLYTYAETTVGKTSDKFTYTSYEQSDSSYFFSSNGAIKYYHLFMSKKIDGKEYIIALSTIIEKRVAEEIVHHIYKSLVPHSNEMELIDGKNDEKGKSENFAMRNTNYYSIEYPKEWKVITNVDQMTDAYIGATNDMLGFTIVFFDTDYSLSEINEEANSNMKEIGAKFITNKKITINGQQCYMADYEYEMSGKKMKNISYVFKKDDTMYSVKFGSDPNKMNANKALIEKIINTFHIK